MDKKQFSRHQRHIFSQSGWAMLAYYLVMLLCVSGVAELYTWFFTPTQEQLDGNAWGYLLSCVFCVALILCVKGKGFWKEQIWAKGRPMKPSTFFFLTALCIGAQVVAVVYAPLLEMLLNLFGVSALESIQSATAGADTFSMFLYVSLGAPIVEELLCRGFVQRSLAPYGKRFAIIASAYLFGLLHGNIYQSPYAFCVGLLLGYTAMEYSIAWSMLLHMINNLLLGDTFSRLMQMFDVPVSVENTVYYALIGACALISCVGLRIKRRQLRAYRKENRIEKRYLPRFFFSAGVMVLTVFMLVCMLMLIQPI